MVSVPRTILIQLLLPALLALPFAVAGQGRFTVNGRLKIEGGDLSQTRVVVYKDGAKERSITSGLNKFTLDLDINHDYILEFEKDGFVSKKISFNTHAPAEASANGFTPFDFAVSLFKQYDDINIVVFNQPVGVIRYDDKTGDFDYDTDYTKSIQSQLQQVLAQVVKKQEEEAELAKANAAKAAEEAKAKAKADAEAAKQAAARAKEVEAKRVADEKAAEKALAEAKKAETPVPEPEKKEVTAVAPPPRPGKSEQKPTLPAPQAEPPRHVLASKANQGQDGRRTTSPIVVEEASRVAKARTNVQEDARPAETTEVPSPTIDQQTLVEPARVTTVVRVSFGEQQTEFRKVIHKFGGIYYFKDGEPCTQQVYESGSRTEHLAGITPRGKVY